MHQRASAGHWFHHPEGLSKLITKRGTWAQYACQSGALSTQNHASQNTHVIACECVLDVSHILEFSDCPTHFPLTATTNLRSQISSVSALLLLDVQLHPCTPRSTNLDIAKHHETSCGWHFEGEGCIHTSEFSEVKPGLAAWRRGIFLPISRRRASIKSNNLRIIGVETGSEKSERYKWLVFQSNIFFCRYICTVYIYIYYTVRCKWMQMDANIYIYTYIYIWTSWTWTSKAEPSWAPR